VAQQKDKAKNTKNKHPHNNRENKGPKPQPTPTSKGDKGTKANARSLRDIVIFVGEMAV
jgi:hypothetical protein